jgi:hypothetical protein
MTRNSKVQQYSAIVIFFIKIAKFPIVTIEELPSNFILNACVQEISIEGLQSSLKDIRIEVFNKIYNEKYKQYLYYNWVSKYVIPSSLPSNSKSGKY